jgi:hypothetical protein
MLPEPVRCPIYFHEDLETIVISVPAAAATLRQDIDLERGTALVQRRWSRQRLGPKKTGRARSVSLLHPVADDTADWRPGATDAARSILAGPESQLTELIGVMVRLWPARKSIRPT